MHDIELSIHQLQNHACSRPSLIILAIIIIYKLRTFSRLQTSPGCQPQDGGSYSPGTAPEQLLQGRTVLRTPAHFLWHTSCKCIPSVDDQLSVELPASLSHYLLLLLHSILSLMCSSALRLTLREVWCSAVIVPMRESCVKS